MGQNWSSMHMKTCSETKTFFLTEKKNHFDPNQYWIDRLNTFSQIQIQNLFHLTLRVMSCNNFHDFNFPSAKDRKLAKTPSLEVWKACEENPERNISTLVCIITIKYWTMLRDLLWKIKSTNNQYNPDLGIIQHALLTEG